MVTFKFLRRMKVQNVEGSLLSERMNLVVVSEGSIITASIQNVKVETISDRDIRGDLNREISKAIRV